MSELTHQRLEGTSAGVWYLIYFDFLPETTSQTQPKG